MNTVIDKYKNLIPIVAAISFFMTALDSTAINTIIPYLSTYFHSSLASTKNIIIYYLIANSLFIPLTGILCQKFSCRIIFCVSLIIFTIGSLLCGLSYSLNQLLIARVIQGIGGAFMRPVGRLAVIQVFSKNELIKALNTVSVPGLVGPLVGPIVGGFIASYIDWSFIFFINIPFGIIGIYFALRYFPTQIEKNTKTDFGGFIIFSLSLAFMTYALSLISETTALKLPSILLLIGLVFFVVYWIRSLFHEYPLFSPNLFKIRSFSVGIFGNLVARFGCGAVPFVLPLMLQDIKGLDPVACGIGMMPLAISLMAAKPFTAPAINWMGYRNFLSINTFILSASFALFCLVDQHSSWTLIVILMFITGFFSSLQFTAMNTVTVIDLSAKQQPAGSCLLSTVMQVSAAAGIAIAAILLTFDQTIHPYTSVASHFHFTWFWLGIMTALSAFIFYLLPHDAY